MTETGRTRTEDLIAQLAADARPVRPLRPPMLRAALWLLIAALVIAAVVALKGVRHERMEELAETSYQLEWAGAMLTGILSAIAAFHVGLPDRCGRPPPSSPACWPPRPSPPAACRCSTRSTPR
jgi:hypothetical protein